MKKATKSTRKQFLQVKQLLYVFIALSTVSFYPVHAQIKVWSGGKVAVGFTGSTPNSLLAIGAVGSSSQQLYSYWAATTTANANAIRGEVAAPTTSIGVYSVTGIVTPGSYGTCVGTQGVAYRASATSGAYAYGLYGYAGNATTGYNYGVYGLLLGSNNGAGIYASVNGITNIPAKYAAYFDGQIRTSNDSPIKPTSGSWSGPSDERLKTDISSFEDGMDILSQINPIKYKFNGVGGLPTDKYYYGVRAQEIEQAAPYTVSRIPLVVDAEEANDFTVIEELPLDSSGRQKSIIEVLGFNYDALIYVMINALKEQGVKMEEIQQRIAYCCADGTNKRLDEESGSNTIREKSAEHTTTVVELLHTENAILYQNIPNPFGDETLINYYLPQVVKNASMIFYNNMGQNIKEVNLEHRGNATLSLKTGELAQGIYSYSLVAEGKIIDTKKMLKNQ